jgi:hypothetical protein
MKQWNSTFNAPAVATMKQSGFRRPAKQMQHRSALKSGQKRLRAKQRAVTAEEKVLWTRLANEVGCIACLLDGRRNTYVSIHHIDGRTKPGCHKNVLPLCGPHHQDNGTAIAVHPDKARFEAAYGTQEELMAKCRQILGE